MALLEFTPAGIYCPEADIYIDPWRKVGRALITHGHSDHARPGHGSYLCTPASVPVLRQRLGKITAEALPFGKKLNIRGVEISFHPAGHVVGSAQVRVARGGDVWVVSGDYKTEDDGISEAFESVKCRTFITECTFGLPVYQWQPQEDVFREINQWWSANKAEGKTSVIESYSLGKAQRIIANVDRSIGRIYCHEAVENMNEAIRSAGVSLPETFPVIPGTNKNEFEGALVIAPSAALASGWLAHFRSAETASASGWMRLRGRRRWNAAGRGFILSDHADWKGLNGAVESTGAETVYVTHGYTDVFSRWLNEKGFDARVINTKFGDEVVE